MVLYREETFNEVNNIEEDDMYLYNKSATMQCLINDYYLLIHEETF